MNSQAVAHAIAVQFAGITTSAGDTLAATPTERLPNTITAGPVILVYPPTGVLDIIMGKTRRDALDFPVRWLSDPYDVPTRSDKLYLWYDAMRDRVEMNMDLDLAYVAWAQLISMRAETDGETYAGALWDVIELIVRVQFNEQVPTVSI